MRRAISSKFHYPFIYQGPTDCRGPGLKPGEPTYSADSYLADPAMRTLEARLHYGLRYSCTWGGTGRAVVIFMRNTLHWSVSVTITAVPPKT